MTGSVTRRRRYRHQHQRRRHLRLRQRKLRRRRRAARNPGEARADLKRKRIPRFARNDKAYPNHKASGVVKYGDPHRGEIWLTKRKHQSNPRRARGRVLMVPVREEIVRGSAVVVADAGPAVLRAKAAADASFSGARKSASSASRKLKTSTTRTTACSGSSSPRAARSCRGA